MPAPRRPAAGRLAAALLLAAIPAGCGDDGARATPGERLPALAARIEGGDRGEALAALDALFVDLRAAAAADPDAADRAPAAAPLDAAPLRRVVAALAEDDPAVVDPDLYLQCALSLRAVDEAALGELDRLAEAKVGRGGGGADAYLARYAGAHVALATGDPSGAATRFAAAIEARPDRAEARFHCGQALLLAGRPDLALAQVDAAIERGFPPAQAAYHRAVILERLERPDEALREFRTLGAARNAWSGRAWNQAGKILAAGGDLDGAEEAFRFATERDPERAPAFYNLARLCYDRGAFERAAEAAARAAELRPGDARARTLLGRIAEDGGDDRGAEVRYREALEREARVGPGADGAAPEAALRLARLLVRAGRADEVEPLRRWFPAGDPTFPGPAAGSDDRP